MVKIFNLSKENTLIWIYTNTSKFTSKLKHLKSIINQKLEENFETKNARSQPD